MNPIRILLGDDHTVMRNGLRLLLERQPNLIVIAGPTGDYRIVDAGYFGAMGIPGNEEPRPRE